MYYMATIEGTVRIPPYKFGENLEDVAIETLNEEYTGKLDKDSGLLVGVTDIEHIGEGVVIMGDGAAYHDVVFKALFFKPEQQEIVVGEVIEIAEFGAFVITDDYINYDARNASLIGKESNKILQQSDKVRARIVALSLKGKSIRDSKIGLTMRQPHLGSFDWIEAEKRKIAEKKAKS